VSDKKVEKLEGRVVRGQTVRAKRPDLRSHATMRFLHTTAAYHHQHCYIIITKHHFQTQPDAYNNSNKNHVTSSPTRNQHRHNVAGSAQLPQKPTAKSPRSSQRSIQRIQRRQRSSQPSQRITRHHPHRRGGRTRNHDPTH